MLEASAFESEVIRPFALWIDALRRLPATPDVFDAGDYDNRDRLFGALRDAGISVILISQASSEHSICFAVPSASAVEVERVVRLRDV